MHWSVKDGVAQRGVADDLVPLFDGQLAGDQGGPEVVAVLQDLEDIAAPLLGQGGQAPVVDNEQVDPGIGSEDPAVPAVRFGQGEVVEEPGRPQVKGAEAYAVCLVSQGPGQIALTGTGGAGDEAVVALADPLPSGQGEHELFVVSAPPDVVDVLERGILTKLGSFQPVFEGRLARSVASRSRTLFRPQC